MAQRLEKLLILTERTIKKARNCLHLLVHIGALMALPVLIPWIVLV